MSSSSSTGPEEDPSVAASDRHPQLPRQPGAPRTPALRGGKPATWEMQLRVLAAAGWKTAAIEARADEKGELQWAFSVVSFLVEAVFGLCLTDVCKGRLGLAEFLHAPKVSVPAATVDTHRNIELYLIIRIVGLAPSDIPSCRAGDTYRLACIVLNMPLLCVVFFILSLRVIDLRIADFLLPSLDVAGFLPFRNIADLPSLLDIADFLLGLQILLPFACVQRTIIVLLILRSVFVMLLMWIFLLKLPLLLLPLGSTLLLLAHRGSFRGVL
ncbi:hypothetical protein PG988_012768 [Apiospora saccharicola]